MVAPCFIAMGTKVSRIASLSILSVLALFAFAGAGMHPVSAFSAPAEPWHQCPAVGLDTSCGLLLVINSDGTVSIYASATQGPYDGSEDTLVGVQDNCSTCGAVASMGLSGSAIFGFDADGACASGLYTPAAPASQCLGGSLQTTDPQDYESSTATFAITDANDGTVNFGPHLTNGANAWFSLEEPLTATSLSVSTISTTSTTATTTTSTTTTTTTTTIRGVPEFSLPPVFAAAVGMLALTLFLKFRKPSLSGTGL